MRDGRAIVGVAMAGLAVFALVVFILPFAFPTPPPIVTRFQATQLFSPNGDGSRDTARVSVRMREPGRVTIEVIGDDGATIRTLAADRPVGRGWLRLPWQGRGDDGGRVPDGSYALRLRARSGQKVFNTSRRIRIDTTPPALAAMDAAPPATASSAEVQCLVQVTPADDASVLLAAHTDATGDPLRVLGPRPVAGGAVLRWAWNGRDRAGDALTPGLYTVTATLHDAARNATRASRTCWIGNLTGRAVGPAPVPGDLVTVALRRPDGSLLPAGTRVRLQLHRRAGTPGPDARVLGRRVARPVLTTAAASRIRLPRTRRVDALWIVADAAGGRALIAPGGTP